MKNRTTNKTILDAAANMEPILEELLQVKKHRTRETLQGAIVDCVYSLRLSLAVITKGLGIVPAEPEARNVASFKAKGKAKGSPLAAALGAKLITKDRPKGSPLAKLGARLMARDKRRGMIKGKA